MSRKLKRRKCRCCRSLFTPDYRNSGRQLFCDKPDCRRASKAHSQRRWLGKSANRDYFRGPAQVERVRQWRQSHPGYWKRRTAVLKEGQVIDPQLVNPKQASCNVQAPLRRTLQDLCFAEQAAVVGLISLVTGSTLQEDIAATTTAVLRRGLNILGLQVPASPQHSMPTDHDRQTSPAARATPAHPR